ncbi:MAG TPA: hypothetical protein VGK56_15945, partial [Anaerolineales bacterium]
TNAMAIAALDQQAADNYEAAYTACYPPTPTIDLTLSVTPLIPTLETPIVTTTEPPPTVEVTTEVPPTEAPTEVPTEVPTTQAP